MEENTVMDTPEVVTEVVTEVTEPVVDTAPTLSEDEAIAIKSGWVPKEEFKGDLENWKTAKQFNEYGQLLDQTYQQKRKIQKLTETTEQLVSSIKDIQEQSYQKALNELKAKTRSAIEVGDVEEVERLQDEQLKIKQTITPAVTPNNIPDHIIEAVKTFQDENKWFQGKTAKEIAMTQFATAREKELLTTGMDYGKILTTIKEEVRKDFSSYFTNQNQTLPSAVSAPTRPVAKSTKLSFSDLPA